VSVEAAFVGTLGRDAQVRVSKTDKQFLQLNIAVGSGDRTQWVNTLVFDTAVIELAGELLKGTRVYVEGRLSLGEWARKDGTAKQGLSVLATHVRICEIGEIKVKRSKQQRSRQGKPAAKDDTLPWIG
jgi:single-stranded DNA-binding protein